jgi:hypothetical protein
MQARKKKLSMKMKPAMSRPVPGKRAPPRPAAADMRSKSAKAASSPPKKQSLLTAARDAARLYEELCEKYNEAAEGYRVQVYNFAARCYRIGLGFVKDIEEFKRFTADTFWVDVRQKPKDTKIMKAVLTFAMKAKSKQLLNRASKTAAVLESLAEQQIDADEVAERLKAGGGIEKLYRDLSPNRNINSRLPDDLELLSPSLAEDDGDVDDDNGDEDVPPWDGHNPFDVDEELDPDADHAGDGARKSSTVTRAASDNITITDFGGAATPTPNPRSPPHFDPSKDLAIDLSDTNVSPQEVLEMKKIKIIAKVCPPDDRGWRAVKAVSVHRLLLIPNSRRPRSGDGEKN